MTTNTWQTAFDEVPQGFEARVIETVRRMEARRAAPRFRTAAILAMVLIFLLGTALALSSLGLLDTLTDTLRTHLLPAAQELVQPQPEQHGAQPDSVNYTVESAINDGEQIYLLVRASATDKTKTLLMDGNAEPSFGSEWWIAYDEQAGAPFYKLAEESNRILVQAPYPRLYAGEESLFDNTISIRYDGEDILYTLTYEGTRANFNGTLHIASVVYHEEKSVTWGELSLSIPLTAGGSVFEAKAPLPLPKMNGILHRLTVNQTPLATYVQIEYAPATDATETQLMNFEDGIWFRWLDADGHPMKEANRGEGIEEIGDRLLVQGSFRAFETPIEEITIEFYNGMTKELFDTLTLPLSKEEE